MLSIGNYAPARVLVENGAERVPMTVDLTNPIFHDEETARRHFEALRWPGGPICPHCGVVGNATELKGKSTRPGVYKCKDCRKPFTATIGTLYERSHIPLYAYSGGSRPPIPE